MRSHVHSTDVPTFDEMLAELLEEPEEVLGVLSDIVNRGRLQADDLPPDVLEILAHYDLVTFLIQRSPGRPIRTWTYPTPMGLKTFAILEREAERQENEKKAASSPRRRNTDGRGKTGPRR